jgi:hypothetical protein
MSPPDSNNPTAPGLFSGEIRDLFGRIEAGPVTVRDLLDLAGGRGYDFVLILAALPFATPIPLPGLSLPFGLLIFLVGLRKMIGGPLWVPRRVLDRAIDPGQARRFAKSAVRLVGWLERFSRPRLSSFVNSSAVRGLEGLLTATAGFFMLMPIPIPLSNGIPACTVLLLATASIGRDGVFFLLGCLGIALNLAYLALIASGGWHTADSLWRHLSGS